MKKPKSITILGRRWFHRGPGNTYHSATVLVDGKQAARVDFRYGYGSQFEWSGMSALNLPDWNQQSESPYSYCERRGIAYHCEVSDVQRKKDL